MVADWFRPDKSRTMVSAIYGKLPSRLCMMAIAIFSSWPVVRAIGTVAISVVFGGMVQNVVRAEQPDGPRRAPNIVLIMADDLGFSDLGCYGGEIETPNLDALAQQGVRFTQFYNTARCWPSRSALLSGYYAQQIRRDTIPGLGGGGNGKRPVWAKLVPEALAKSNYRSYHSGKWHIDGKVLAAGFHKSYLVNNHGNFFSNQGNSIDDKPVAETKTDDFYVTDATAEHAIACLQEHAGKYSDQPFFSYVAFTAPHFPLHAKPKDIAKYADKYSEGWEEIRRNRHSRQLESGLVNTPLSEVELEIGPPYAFPEAMKKLGPNEVNRPYPWKELTEDQKKFQATKMAIHAAMVDSMDQAIGRMVNQLKAMGEFENTLILFCSDNGASAEIMVRDGGHDPSADMGSAATYLSLGPGFSNAANTPFRRHKTWVHEGGISTPLIAHWPRGIQGQARLIHEPAHLIDIVPTLLELAAVPAVSESFEDSKATEDVLESKVAPKLPGTSLVPVFSDAGVLKQRSLWWLHEGNRAIRLGNWKLVATKGQPWELYDLSTDRAEQNDLAGEHPDRVKQMAALWEEELELFKGHAGAAD